MSEPGKLTAIPIFRFENIGDVYPSDMAALFGLLVRYPLIRYQMPGFSCSVFL